MTKFGSVRWQADFEAAQVLAAQPGDTPENRIARTSVALVEEIRTLLTKKSAQAAEARERLDAIEEGTVIMSILLLLEVEYKSFIDTKGKIKPPSPVKMDTHETVKPKQKRKRRFTDC